MTPEEASDIASRALQLFGSVVLLDEFCCFPIGIGVQILGFLVQDRQVEQPMFIVAEATREEFNEQRSALGLEPFLDCPEARFYRCTTD